MYFKVNHHFFVIYSNGSLGGWWIKKKLLMILKINYILYKILVSFVSFDFDWAICHRHVLNSNNASKHHSCLSLAFLLRECLGDAHEPCDCETWKMWLQKVSEMKPEECRNSRLFTFIKSRMYCSSRPAPFI